MKVLITESKLYNTFTNWMDMDVKGGILQWRMDSSGTIYLIKNDDVVLVKTYKSGRIFVTKDLVDEIKNFFPIDDFDILKMIGGFVAKKVNQPVEIPKIIKDKVQTYGDTFQI